MNRITETYADLLKGLKPKQKARLGQMLEAAQKAERDFAEHGGSMLITRQRDRATQTHEEFTRCIASLKTGI
jgi:hypothetical protein